MEKDYSFGRDLAISTVLAMLLPRGFFSKAFLVLAIIVVAILTWGAFTSTPTPAPLSIMHVDGPVAAMDYVIGSPDGEDMQEITITNNTGVTLKYVIFSCVSSVEGSFDMAADATISPNQTTHVRAMSQTSDPNTSCKLKSYKTFR